MAPWHVHRTLRLAALGLLACAVACDRQAPGTPTPAEAPATETPATQQTPVQVAAEDPVPRVQMRLAGPFVSEGSQGNQAFVDDMADVTYLWILQGGTIEGGGDTPTVTYTVDDHATDVRLFCRLTRNDGHAFTAQGVQRVVALPAIDAFTAAPPAITTGAQGNLLWTAKEIKSLTLDPGGVDVTKVGSYAIQPRETTTYKLTAVNLAGAAIAKELTVKVVPPPEIASFGAEGRAMAGQPVSIKAEFSHGHAEIRQGDTLLAASDQSPLTVSITPADSTTVTLTVTNEGGTMVSQSRTFRQVRY